eukprot:m.308666 g.308666  ORF g.308666 m.308666 type:complete len:179 (+) comp44473_c0_seq1:931-1467(+)
MDTDGGGWTVFQRRKDGSEDFYRGWNDYKGGFGNVSVEFWLGLDKINWLLNLENKENELRIDLKKKQTGTAVVYSNYAKFSVGDESSGYVLRVSNYSGTAGNNLALHNGMKFTTKDNDNDPYVLNCAKSYHGAWWYKSCHSSNLNGGYHYKDFRGMMWYATIFKFTEMKFRFSEKAKN